MTRKVANTSSGNAADSGATSARVDDQPADERERGERRQVGDQPRQRVAGAQVVERARRRRRSRSPARGRAARPRARARGTSPEIRCPPWLTANQSVASASPSSTRDERRRLPVGGAWTSARRPTIATTSTTASATTSAVDRVDNRDLSLEAPALECPPEFHDDARIPQVRARGLLETAQPMAQRVGVHVQRAGRVVDPHARGRDRSAACPRAPSRGPRSAPDGAPRTRRRAPRRRGSPGRIERSARLNAPTWPNASAVCSARLA